MSLTSGVFGSLLEIEIDAEEAAAQRKLWPRALKRCLTTGPLALYALHGPPGAATTLAACTLYREGDFDGLLLEPAGQFTPPHHDLNAVARGYLRGTWHAIKANTPSGVLSRLWRKDPLRILVSEKPQHFAPGLQMGYARGLFAGHTTFIRPPQDCLSKLYDITYHLIMNHGGNTTNPETFLNLGVITRDDPVLMADIRKSDPTIPCATKAWDSMRQRNDFHALTPKAWLIGRERYDREFQAATAIDQIKTGAMSNGDVYRWYAQQWNDSARRHKGPTPIPETPDWLAHMTGWKSLEAIQNLITATGKPCPVWDFNNGQLDKAAQKILNVWNVPKRSPTKPMNMDAIHVPYPILGLAYHDFQKSNGAPLETPPPAKMPDFLARVTANNQQYYDRLRSQTFTI